MVQKSSTNVKSVKYVLKTSILSFPESNTVTIISREFFGQGWMKNDKNEKTPYIMTTTKHFNDVHMYLW